MEVRARGHSHRSLSLCRWLASHCCSESSGQWPASAREDLRISADGGCEAAARTRQQLHRTAQIIPFKQMGIGTGFRTRCSLLTFREIFRVFFLILKFSPLHFPSYSFYRYRAEPLGVWEVTFSKYKQCKFTGTCVLLWLVSFW